LHAELTGRVTDPRSFVTHLECSGTGERVPAHALHGLSPAGRPLLVRYDLEAARGSLTAAALAGRPPDLWRWREILHFFLLSANSRLCT